MSVPYDPGMAEFTFDIDVSVSDERKAARNPYTEGMLSLRAVVVEAVDVVQAQVRAAQVIAALQSEGRRRR